VATPEKEPAERVACPLHFPWTARYPIKKAHSFFSSLFPLFPTRRLPEIAKTRLDTVGRGS